MVKLELKNATLHQLIRRTIQRTTKRLFLLLGGLLALGLQATVSAQEVRVTLDCKNMTLEQVFKNIEKQTKLFFFFSNNTLDVDKPVTISVKNEPLERVLEKIVGSEYNYKISDKLIVIEKKESKPKQAPPKAPPAEKQERKTRVIGVVKDRSGEVLVGAGVMIKGLQKGMMTDVNGVFSFDIDVDKHPVIIVTYVGMKKKEVTVESAGELVVVMDENESQLAEVVITGIFKKSSTAYTGSVSVISEKEIKSFGDRNLISTLSNIDPSFNILTNNNAGFDPNRLPDLQIRGTSSIVGIKELQDGSQSMLNTPLILLDGFEISLQRMMDLDNDEVESVTLLKDGSATAIYGSRGANGIIVITTKEPEMGKLKFSYTGGVNVEIPDLTDYHLLNARDKLELERLSGFYSETDPVQNLRAQQKYAATLADVERGVDTYWLSKPLRTGVGQRHNLKIEGGDRSFRYSATAQYNQISGVMKQSGRNNFNGGLNLSYKREDLTFRNALMIGNNIAVNSPYGSFADYVALNPYWKPYDDNGNIVKFFDTDNLFWGGPANYPRNPLYNATLPTIDQRSYTSIINNFSVEWRKFESINVRANFGINYEWNESDNFKPRTHTMFESYSQDDIMRKGKYVYGVGKNLTYNASITASYSKLINKLHNIYLGLNGDINENNVYGYSFTAEGFTQENPKSITMALAYQKGGKPAGYESIKRRVGMVANANYSFANRYFADVSYRVDGSSQFGKNKRFAPFYSVGLGWNLHNEKFMKPLKAINRFVLRGSVGENGSQQFQSFQAISMYNYYTDDRYYEWMGIYQKALENTELEWQKTMKYNVGLETDMFSNRFGLKFDIYRENTANMLSDRALPWSSGFPSYTENIGMMQNNGFELRLKGSIIRDTERRITLNVAASIASNMNKILSLSDALKQLYALEEQKVTKDPSRIIREGQPVNTIFAVQSLGIDPSNGQELFLKNNGDVTYTWSPEDLRPVGISTPKFRGTATSAFRYKNVSLNLAFAYYWGGQVYNSTLVNKIENANKRYNVDERVYTDRWKEVGDHSFFKGLNNTSATNATSRFVQNDNVFTCKNINIGYELRNNKGLKKYTGVESLTISGNASDIFYLSTVRQERGISYPFSRRFALSLTLLF